MQYKVAGRVLKIIGTHYITYCKSNHKSLHVFVCFFLCMQAQRCKCLFVFSRYCLRVLKRQIMSAAFSQHTRTENAWRLTAAHVDAMAGSLYFSTFSSFWSLIWRHRLYMTKTHLSTSEKDVQDLNWVQQTARSSAMASSNQQVKPVGPG